MHLAIFSESYEPIVNGVSVCVATLRDGLLKAGSQVTVFAPAFAGHCDCYSQVVRVPSLRTPFMPSYPVPVPINSLVSRSFKDSDIDIIHTQTPFVLGMMGRKIGRRNNIPVISTNHTLYTEYAHYFPLRPKLLTKYMMKIMMKNYYNGCEVVIVPSAPVARILESYGVKSRIEIVKTGVEPADGPLDTETRTRLRSEFIRSEETVLLLYVGRIAREKNMGMLLRALKQLISAGVDAKLVVVGGGPALKETEVYAQSLGLEESAVVFTGMMPREQIRELYRLADIFVFPSTTETQGIAICEAMSAGLPVVAVNAGGIPENVTDGVDGFLTIDSHEAFADRIRQLIDSPSSRLEMGAKARVSAGKFTVDKMIEQMQQIYGSVLGR